MNITAGAFGAWLAQEQYTLVLGSVVSGALLLVLMLALVRFSTPVLRWVADHTWQAFALATVVLGPVVAVPMILLRQPLLVVPVGVPALTGIALLAVGSLVMFVKSGDDDPITAPGEGPAPADGRLLTALILPIMTLAVLLITWVPFLFA